MLRLLRTIATLARLFGALLAVLAVAPAWADSWIAPQRTTYYSANRAARLIVTPHVPADRSLRPYVNEPRSPSAPDVARAVLQRLDGPGRWVTSWQGPLRNEVMPVSAMIADSGRYFVTFDDWGGHGSGPNVVVIYDGAGRTVRALSILDLLPEDYVRTLPRSVSSVYWGGQHSFSGDGETLQLALALPGELIFPSGYFQRDLTLADGLLAPLEGPEWERALATAATWRVMEQGRRAAERALAVEPILPPRSSDPEQWQTYLTEVLRRREGPLAGVPMVILFRRPPSQDYVRWGGTPRRTLLSPNLGLYTAIASPDGLPLAPALAPIVASHRAGWLRNRQLLIVADEAAWPDLLRIMGPSGATMIRIDPATPVPQRPEAIREYDEIQAALTRNESAQD